jgi:hypothetical protein
MSEQQNQSDAQQDALRQRLQALSREITPARDLWPQIAAKLQDQPAQAQSDRSNSWWHGSQALAAALLVAVLTLAIWQQLPESLPMTDDAQVSAWSRLAADTDDASALTAESAAESMTQAMLQGMLEETVTDTAWLPRSAANADLHAGLREYDLAAAQLQQALVQQPDNQHLWQQLSSLEVSRMNMFAVHIQ